jgi:CobQ-like glutamine amidotransferase family enzyme
MNIYGDNGNVLTIQRRLEWYGYTPVIHAYNPGDTFPETVDLIIGGGGQDSGQGRIQEDLQKIAPKLKALADNDTPMLVICGLYQLFGHHFDTHDGTRINGIGILDITTTGEEERLVGNIITQSEEFGDIIGYENHSGQTKLGDGATPLATVRIGAGNNTHDTHEGARYKNVIGSYLHGSLLPKNPAIADFLIRHAITNRYGEFSAMPIDDRLTERARQQALTRPR